MAGKIQTVIRLIQKGNILDVLEAVFRNLRKTGIYIQINEFFSCAPAEPQSGAAPAGFSTRRIKLDHVADLSSLSNKTEQTFLTRLQALEDACWGIYFNDSLAGYAWISARMIHIPELELEQPLAENELYLYDGFVHERYHRRGLFGAFLSSLRERAGVEGKTVVVTVDWINYKARKAYISSGFQKTGTGRLIKLGRWWKQYRFRPAPSGGRAVSTNQPNGNKKPLKRPPVTPAKSR